MKLLNKVKNKNKVKILCKNKITEMIEGYFINQNVVRTSDGDFLALVEPDTIFFNSKHKERVYLRRGSEFFLRNLDEIAINENKKINFIYQNNLYINVTEEYNSQISDKSEKKFLIVKEIEIPLENIITIENNVKIIPYFVSDSEYLRYENAEFQNSQISYQLIKAMKKNANSDKFDIFKMIIPYVVILGIIFFYNGGMKLIWIW